MDSKAPSAPASSTPERSYEDFHLVHFVENVITEIHKNFPADGLLPIFISPHTGETKPYSTITFGAMGDSFYEYLLKVWIQGNKTESVKHYREMWETSMNGLRSLIRKTERSSFTYISEKNGGALNNKMDELACFAPGMLALGSSGYGPGDCEQFLSLAEEMLVAAFIFGNTAKTIFESVIFVFVMHPFDVGDRCVIDGVQMVVEEMNILTTVFLRYDNEKIYYPNSVLATRPISNFYRSPDMGDAVEFSVDVSTSVESIGALKARIKMYTMRGKWIVF